MKRDLISESLWLCAIVFAYLLVCLACSCCPPEPATSPGCDAGEVNIPLPIAQPEDCKLAEERLEKCCAYPDGGNPQDADFTTEDVLGTCSGFEVFGRLYRDREALKLEWASCGEVQENGECP